MKIGLFKIGPVLVGMLLVQGCATIFTGTSDTVTFETDPPGARVIVNGIDLGRTPLTTSFRRSLHPQFINYRLDGYEQRTVEMGRRLNGVAYANLLCLWFFALCGGVDGFSGALMVYDPASYLVVLEPTDPSPVP